MDTKRAPSTENGHKLDWLKHEKEGELEYTWW